MLGGEAQDVGGKTLVRLAEFGVISVTFDGVHEPHWRSKELRGYPGKGDGFFGNGRTVERNDYRELGRQLGHLPNCGYIQSTPATANSNSGRPSCSRFDAARRRPR